MRSFKGILFVCLVVVLSGCMGKSIPKETHYELGIHTGILASVNKQASEIGDFIVVVSPKIAGKKIAYKTDQNRIEYFVKNAWIEPFSTMLESLAKKIASNIESPNANKVQKNAPQKELKINVLDCYFDRTKEQVAVNVLAESSGKSALISIQENVESGDFSKIIEAFERAVNRALLQAFLQG